MTLHGKGALRRRALLLLWVVVVVSSEVTFLLAAQGRNDRAPLSSPSRKSRLFGTATSTPSLAAGAPLVAINDDPDPDKLYEEDKRIIHTGPNPLHN